jgi:hypothetical protein
VPQPTTLPRATNEFIQRNIKQETNKQTKKYEKQHRNKRNKEVTRGEEST